MSGAESSTPRRVLKIRYTVTGNNGADDIYIDAEPEAEDSGGITLDDGSVKSWIPWEQVPDLISALTMALADLGPGPTRALP